MIKNFFAYIFNGSKDVSFGLLGRIIVGIKFILLIICGILTSTLVLAPVTIPLGMVCARSLTYNGRFVGIKNIFFGLLQIVLLVIFFNIIVLYF